LGALRLVLGKKTFAWHRLNGSPEASLESRGRFRHALYHFLLALDVEEQRQAMDMFRSWSGVTSNETTTRAMTHDELVGLTTGGLIEIGAHTLFHPMLPRLTVERQREQIVANKHELEEILGRRVDGFAYPNGRATDDAKRIVRDAGFAYACTSLQDVVRPASNLHELTRFWQKDVDGERFLHRLKFWMSSL
jgi:hypothetical protein